MPLQKWHGFEDIVDFSDFGVIWGDFGDLRALKMGRFRIENHEI